MPLRQMTWAAGTGKEMLGFTAPKGGRDPRSQCRGPGTKLSTAWVRSLGWEDTLEKGKATHPSVLAWRIPWSIVNGVAKSRTRLSDFHCIEWQILNHSLDQETPYLLYRRGSLEGLSRSSSDKLKLHVSLLQSP